MPVAFADSEFFADPVGVDSEVSGGDADGRIFAGEALDIARSVVLDVDDFEGLSGEIIVWGLRRIEKSRVRAEAEKSEALGQKFVGAAFHCGGIGLADVHPRGDARPVWNGGSEPLGFGGEGESCGDGVEEGCRLDCRFGVCGREVDDGNQLLAFGGGAGGDDAGWSGRREFGNGVADVEHWRGLDYEPAANLREEGEHGEDVGFAGLEGEQALAVAATSGRVDECGVEPEAASGGVLEPLSTVGAFDSEVLDAESAGVVAEGIGERGLTLDGCNGDALSGYGHGVDAESGGKIHDSPRSFGQERGMEEREAVGGALLGA